MYTTEIVMIEDCSQVGPIFFSGSCAHEQYKTVTEARKAAEAWASQKGLTKGTYKIISRIVGCL